MDQKHWLLGLFLLGCGLLGLGWFFNRQAQTPLSQMAKVRSVQLPSPAFHPDQVVEFKWTVGEKSFVFKRRDVNSPWEPQEGSMGIQQRLVLLAQIHKDKMESSTADLNSPIVRVDLKLADLTSYGGYWVQQRFIWDDGPHRGQGSRLDTSSDMLFMAGRYAFATSDINWCRGRMKLITYSHGTSQWTLTNQNSKWIKTWKDVRGAPQIEEIDPTMIDRWMGESCLIKTDFSFDPKLSVVPLLAEQSLTVDFEDRSRARFEVSHEGRVHLSEANQPPGPDFVSNRFALSLRSLKAIAKATE